MPFSNKSKFSVNMKRPIAKIAPENKNPKKTTPLAPPDAKLGKKAEQTPKAEDMNRLTPESLPKLDLKDTNSSGKRRPRV
jgi:hypothetical protein